MRVIDTDAELLPLLDAAQNVLLIEPPWDRRFPPLGLAKIASYVQKRGGRVVYRRGYDGLPYDLICIGTIFTYEYGLVRKALTGIRMLNADVPILLGGPCVSLIPQKFADTDATIFKGYSPTLDEIPPDLSIDWGLDDEWRDFAFVFTSRGCPNHCAYCAVWRIEKQRWINPNWKAHIAGRKKLAIFDNNLSACALEHVNDVFNTLEQRKIRVCFDNGFDIKFVTPEMAQRLARLKYANEGMRIAFDRIEEDGDFQRAVRMLLVAGVPKSQIMAYVLFNFTDSPQEADYRMRECHKLGIHPYPQRYMPLSITTREQRFVGKKWTDNLARAFRFYWLMPGIYRQMDFMRFIGSHYNTSFKLTHEDIVAWQTP